MSHRTRRLAAGIRDIEHVPAGSREAFFGTFRTVHAALMAGRRDRGGTRLPIAGAIGHAITFLTPATRSCASSG